MNIEVKNWSSGSSWKTTVKNFGSQHFRDKAMGRFLDVLVDKGIMGEKISLMCLTKK